MFTGDYLVICVVARDEQLLHAAPNFAVQMCYSSLTFQL